MRSEVCIQPFSKNGKFMLGNELKTLLNNSDFKKIWFVSFSVRRGGVIRILPELKNAIANGAEINLILGIDHNSTSIEAIDELLKIKINSKILKDTSFAHTFHPKIYLFEGSKNAELFVGSNNLTAGGIFTNYESCIHISFDLSKDKAIYKEHKKELEPVINPKGITVKKLTKSLVETLKKSKDVVSESVTRQEYVKRTLGKKKKSVFGSQKFPDLPAMPIEYQKKIVKQSNKKQAKVKTVLALNSVYIQLNKIQGTTIPGEVRIPKALRNIDEPFWGWPKSYTIQHRKLGEKERTYSERKTQWEIIDSSKPTQRISDTVRIYDYKERGEFRFYSNKLVETGADEFDIIKLTIHPDQNFDYQCELAKRGSTKYLEWEKHCSVDITNSQRKYGID